MSNFTNQVDHWTMLQRALILGSSGGKYVAGNRQIDQGALATIEECIKADGLKTVEMVRDISVNSRGPKNEFAIMALAQASQIGDKETRRAANEAMPAICRTGTHLFQWIDAVNGNKGMGRSRRRAVDSWYKNRKAQNLAYQVLKYRQRKVGSNSWTHRDVIRVGHPKAASPEHAAVFDWVCGRGLSEEYKGNGLAQIAAFEQLQTVQNVGDVVKLVKEHSLPRECVDGKWFGHEQSALIWDALLGRMPFGAMVRNLGNMSKSGLLVEGSPASDVVVARLTDPERVQRSRIHPIQLLAAKMTYETGAGQKGSGTWAVDPKVVEALEAAFYLSFGNTEDTGKRWLLSMDVSGSMTWVGLMGIRSLTPLVATAVLAMVTARTQAKHDFVAFSHQLVPVPITKEDTLAQAMQKMGRVPMGATDCALPMLYAMEAAKVRQYDVFVVLTDNETNYGQRTHRIAPAQALRMYREKTGIDAKLIVVGMVSNNISIADPQDKGMLDVVGFDASAPKIMNEFVLGNV